MTAHRFHEAIAGILVVLAGAASFAADPVRRDSAIIEQAGVQHACQLRVRVVDADGQPVANVEVSPWALRSSQGHGWWRQDDKDSGIDPQTVMTDADGRAIVEYPFYRDRDERVRTLQVSLQIDHPEFAFDDDIHIDVPPETEVPQLIKLTRGVPVEIRPLLNGVPGALENLHVMWSDSRAWQPGTSVVSTPEGTLRVPAMKPGAGSLHLVKLDGDRVTHSSGIVNVTVPTGPRYQLDVPLQPAARITGRLSDNVPRPVINGRVVVWALPPRPTETDRVRWNTWRPVQQDGTFVIDGWPANEALQIIALCDGFIAASGDPPAGIEPPKSRFNRPQLFEAHAQQSLEVKMTPLVRCAVLAIDEHEKPISGIQVRSWPNVQWWYHLSQLYCHPLVRGELLIQTRDYEHAADDRFPQPFSSVTDKQGRAVLELPVGKEELAVESDLYELPVFLGGREQQVELVAGKPCEQTLRLQARGTDTLGEWDKLAGVVFGCSTREGRRICALPRVREKMDEFVKRFREASNQRDPQMLSEAFSFVAEAFAGVGDQEEAERWRKKAAVEAGKVSK